MGERAGAGGLVRRLMMCGGILEIHGISADAILEAAERIRELERAVELSRLWWDDTDPYHAAWNHGGSPCDRTPCAACQARSAAIMALANREGGGRRDGLDARAG